MVLRRCPQCGSTCDDQYGFCIKCGFEFENIIHQEHQCPLCGFENPEGLLYWLKSHIPPQDRAVTHGDFCLPNLFTDGKRFTGFIDVGKAGAGDRWMDLALGWRSLKHNSDGHYGKIYPDIHPDDLFRAAGVPKDEEKLRYYILLDELN